MKTLLIESMILYNIAQVVFNAWMVYTICIALLYNGHPFMGSRELYGPAINSGATRAVYVHYCDKYLEFVDTYFMILRGKIDQVSQYNYGVSRDLFFIYINIVPYFFCNSHTHHTMTPTNLIFVTSFYKYI